MEYTEKVLEHFRTPHNVGVIEDADGTGQVGDASCGDVFLMTIRVHDERLVDIKYLVQGCGAAIATCSALSDVAMGKTLAEAMAPSASGGTSPRSVATATRVGSPLAPLPSVR